MWIVWKKEEEESSSMPSKSNHGRNKKKIALSQQSRTDGRTHQTEDEYCRVERQAKSLLFFLFVCACVCIT